MLLFPIPAQARAKKADAREALGAKALGLLHKAMLHDDPDVRVMASEQWGPIGNKTAVTMLSRALEDLNLYVRIAAAGSLFQLGDESGVPVVEKIVSTAPKPGEKNSKLAALDEMRTIAKNKVRIVAIRSLASMGKTTSIKTLRKTAESDPDGAVRDAATIALARLGAAPIDSFAEALSSEDDQVRIKAANALGEIGGAEILAPLKAAAEDPNAQVRAAVMEALGSTGDVLALPELKTGIADQNALVKAKAVTALGRINSPSSIPLLEEVAADSSNGYLELLAVAGLARLGKKVEVGVAQRALAQPDADTRLLAVEVLEAAGTQTALENLDIALDDNEAKVRVRAAAALVKLLQHKNDPKAPASGDR